jgi:gliding motility-associated-like protein
MYLCTNLQGTFHIVLYESTNVIENHIQNKPNCPNWAFGTAVQGIHNQPGTAAVTVPGRNSTAWTTTNNSYRYTPNGAVVTPTLTWYQVGNPIPIATGVNTITVTPPPAGANYTCHFVYPICNAGWSTCNSNIGLGPDTVFVAPGPPNLNPLTVTTTNPTCNGYCDGVVAVQPTNGTAPYTYVWSTSVNGTPILSALCDGRYSVLVTDANGCTISATATITDPPTVTTGPITFNDTVCFNASNEVYSVPNQLGYTFNWSAVGSITAGQNSNAINVDWNGIGNGFILGAVQVTAYNSVGCSSLPVAIDLQVLNVLPVIDPIGPFCSYDVAVPLSAIPPGGTFAGPGVTNNMFDPVNANNITNTITYTYIQSTCIFDTSMNIDVFPRPMITPILPSNDFFELCEGDSISGTYATTWTEPGYNVWTMLSQTYQQDNLTVSWDSPGMFNISVVHWANGCVSLPQSTMITIVQCPDLLLYIANSFTPDGDEHNNSWRPVFTSGFDPYDFQLTVYNRWGEIIFQSFNALDSWDATYNNTPVQSGVYTWLIQYGDTNNDNETVLHGSVTIIR